MMNRKIVIVLGLCICIIWSVYAVTISVQNESDTDVSDRGQDICAGQDESVTDADYNIQDLATVPQCIWQSCTDSLDGANVVMFHRV